MSRPIKFRAWDSEEEEMYFSDEDYGHHFFEFKNGQLHCFAIREPSPGHGYSSLYEPPEPTCEEIDNPTQFTGLFSKDGKKIWEGDIVKNYYRNDPYKIIFYDGSFRGWYGRGEKPSQDMRGFAFDEFEAKGSEVIGDVYSTPELLEDK